MSQSGLRLVDWLSRLETLSSHEIVMGLDRVRDVQDRMAIRYPDCVIHVAGTNGKGSSVAMLRSLLQERPATVGTYTSPHVFDYNERIGVGGRP